MAPSRENVEALVMRVQNDFLATPDLTLPLSQAPRRFGVDAHTCTAILEMLRDAGVLTVTREGAYARLFPRRGIRVALHAA